MDGAPFAGLGAADLPGTAAAEHALVPLRELLPYSPAELDRWFRGGEPEADELERMLAWASRGRGAIDVAIAEGLAALRHGERLASLGFHLDDYAREVLGIGKRAAEGLARLGTELPARPRLREALRSGRVGLRAAETVLAVATGDAEAFWVERAARQTVRELEDAVRRAGSGGPEDADEAWVTLRTQLPEAERIVVDAALEAAGRIMPGSTRSERLEALAQEYLAEFSTDGDHDGIRPLGPELRPAPAGERSRRAALESEPERWPLLEPVEDWPAPEVRFDDGASAQEIDRTLRELAAARATLEEVIGACAYAIRRSGMHLRLGFSSFRHYVEERLRLPPRTVEQRAEHEERLARSAGLREARRQGVSYERRRILAQLPDDEIAPWIPRAKALTCVALRRAVEGERERQLRAQRKVSVPLPRRVAVLLSAAFETVRKRVGRLVPAGSCLAILGAHFLGQWDHALKGSRSRSEQVRERDLGWCQVPGCSHRAAHAHHVLFRSQGGGDEAENQVALCAFHHLRCVHGGYLTVFGRAPDGLTWLLGGAPFSGMAGG
ncbi:HNH endonuclease signature motif containing protein [Anaeromyxobacter dehalogenans]|nr:HNH endonuclease signature motif containing protein [Anaeromyxobacter dehalogenans]